ncbi:uncharacterized protein DUF421 [Pseudorhodoplanes sinuspersici]|uniref:YetF C-terminal domain-containing protein n=2 Tax=Pseudorhodoplanes sinuspersici TaxID=1235591 RepID=A0A1W6ZSC9_9HYPH|nr:hypothetical protein CAK95_11585 [Pseudorhodoplanes sinuspersici]RKE70632.1 uncharacterized protein DUF421 [Pseudorhodoplanes sinuspersici]
METLISVDWYELFVPTHSIAEMILRGTLMYLGLFLIFRFMVGRQSAAIGLTDVLVIVIIADAAQNAFAREYRSVSEGIVLVLTIVFWDFALDWLGYRSRFFGWLIKPAPLPLVRDGKMLFKNMRREMISADDLLSQARQQGIADIADVEAACLESNGEISFIKRDRSNTTKGKRQEVT